MTINKKAPAFPEAPKNKRLHFNRIIDAITVIYLTCILITLFVGVLS